MSNENLKGEKSLVPRRSYDGAASRRVGVRSEHWQAEQNRAAKRRQADAAKNTESTPAPKSVVAPAETVIDPEAPLIVTRGEIELGEAFLRRAVGQSPGISVAEALRQIEDSYLRLLCRRVVGVMPQVIKAGRTMNQLSSIEVIREKTPDGVKELLRCNFTPKNSGQILLDDFRKGI